MNRYNPCLLLEYVRDGLVERFHSGFILKLNKDNSFSCAGEDYNYPFYLRSCAKPLQASLLIDFGLDKKYSLSSEEIAVCCASHTGETVHLNVIESLMSKFGLCESMYKCGIHMPLSKSKQDELLLNGHKPNVLHNNCSGKHTMMLAICNAKGWDIETYNDINHPLQRMIKEKIYDLCRLEKEYPITTDGCGVPIFSMPLKNMLLGYKNLFLSEKYKKICSAFLDNYYLIGGENRLDTAIVSSGNYLAAKVGAGGLCIVINTKTSEGIVVKIADCNMEARAITTIEALKQLGWINSENELLKEQNKKDIKILDGRKVGQVNICFDISKF